MKKGLDHKELKEAEQKIQNIYCSNESGIFSKEELQELRMEERKRSLLLLQEEKLSRLKSIDVWLEARDKNTKYFPKFSSHRKKTNTILEIKDEEGGAAQLFKEMTKQQ